MKKSCKAGRRHAVEIAVTVAISSLAFFVRGVEADRMIYVLILGERTL